MSLGVTALLAAWRKDGRETGPKSGEGDRPEVGPDRPPNVWSSSTIGPSGTVCRRDAQLGGQLLPAGLTDARLNPRPCEATVSGDTLAGLRCHFPPHADRISCKSGPPGVVPMRPACPAPPPHVPAANRPPVVGCRSNKVAADSTRQARTCRRKLRGIRPAIPRDHGLSSPSPRSGPANPTTRCACASNSGRVIWASPTISPIGTI